ncbi:regulatory protein, luxR family [Ruegeria halocynthiae]|uniref:Regulatory protein, luxR family n=1 Tax=Ruegeria halocynthiae TaxID=985054 RepID=A0A1H2V149_9RHOB|nr:response regulator transcription factor [Ruegeria halocynthiae]SDW62056.1 regulatory protein, luxR family [Ruegeria halocynthiae]
MNISLQDDARDQIEYPEELSIIFIGKELFYSNQTLRSVQNEFGVRASRFDCLDDFLAEAELATSAERIVVVDQMMLEDFLARPADYSRIAETGCLAFAYRKKSPARTLFERWDRMRFGNIGYLPMNVAPDVWRAILRLLMHEELHLPCFLADSMPVTPGAPGTPVEKLPATRTRSPEKLLQYAKLTRREKQVLRLVSQGKSNKGIASKLGITEHTVKLHMHNVSGKIDVSNRTEAAHFYFEVAPNEARSASVG